MDKFNNDKIELLQMKNFAETILKPQFAEEEVLDPYTHCSPEVIEQIKQSLAVKTNEFLISNAIIGYILAPIQTITTSLQLSVKPHKNLYEENKGKANSKALSKLNTQLSIHEKRKLELMIHAGTDSRPYTAPVYGSYVETIKGLMKQGWRAFYKGAFFRTIHQTAHLFPLLYINNLMVSYFQESDQIGIQLMLLYPIVLDSLVMNSFHIQQNRRILQNHKKDFRVYKNFFKDQKKIFFHQQSLTGWKFHSLNFLVSLTTKLPLLSIMPNGQLNQYLFLLYVAGETILYPVSTAYKRVICQTTRVPGMIPHRYAGIYHAMKVIFYEEGVKALYRGYPLYIIGVYLRLALVTGLLRGRPAGAA